MLSGLTVTIDVTVIALHGPHLSAVEQDTLTKPDPSDYLCTQTWARTPSPRAPRPTDRVSVPPQRGPVRLDAHHRSGKPTHPALDVAAASVNLQSPAGLLLVERILAHYNATLPSTA
ncbi:hypothetical protein [Rhodococcus sp. JVH1]|uniref:hypothetical protein n=1 Tax=Rhodococcus sp. JVH1 TaxID=745408 RepID=UPI000271E5F2|nr:hypothetical protein [Rhodococcus sp. JVH1]EJI94410.1 hypothetical protein JVH1_8374 [Rhodococcus sp. JVH1]